MNRWMKTYRGALLFTGLAILALATLLFSVLGPGKGPAGRDEPLALEQEEEAGQAFSGPAQPPEAFPFAEAYEEYEEWLIKWKPGYPPPESDQFEVMEIDHRRQIMLVRLSKDVNVKDWYQHWAKRDDVEYLRPNQRVEINRLPVLPQDAMEFRRQQSHLEQINAEEAWAVETSGETVIAIVDTGLDLEHPLLKPFIVEGAHLVTYTEEERGQQEIDPSPQDYNGHGTQVAGVIVAAQNEWGYRALLNKAKLMPVKVMQDDGSGTEFDVAQGIYHAVDHGADIIVLSVGFPYDSQWMREAVEYADQHGVLVLAATGNSSEQEIAQQVSYPAAYPSVLAVGAVNEQDEHAPYSNFGPEVDLVAPGTVYTTDIGGQFIRVQGTSMAVPQVAGLAALVMERYPELSPLEIRNHLIYTAEPLGDGWNIFTGYGRIDVGRALSTPPVKNIYENHLPDEAAPLPIETRIYSELSNRDDSDYFYVETPYDGKLHLDVILEVGKYTGVELHFYPNGDESQGEVFIIQKDEQIVVEVPRGVSLLKLNYHKEEQRPTPLPYQLTNTFNIYEDSQSPNGSSEEAYPLPADGQVLTGTLHEPESEDWFYFEVPGEGKMEVVVNVYTSRMDPVLRIYTSSGHELVEDDDDPPWEERFTGQVRPGRYYIVVTDYYGNQVDEEYFLMMTFNPGEGAADDF